MEKRTYRRLKQPITPDAAYNTKSMLVYVHRLRQMVQQYERLKTSRWPSPYRSRDRRVSWAFLEAVHPKASKADGELGALQIYCISVLR